MTMSGWQRVAEEATAKLHVQHAEIKRLKAELAEVKAELVKAEVRSAAFSGIWPEEVT